MQLKVEICGVNTATLAILTAEEMDTLLRRVKEGDKAAREKLISGNLRLVLSTIQRFGGRGEPVDDLFQVGCVGLIKAIDNFNVDLGVRFSTYAVPMIIGEIRRYLRDNSVIRVSRSMRDTAYRALQVKEEFMREHQREPTITEIADALGMKKAEVVFALDAILDPVSLFEPVWGEEGDALCVMDQVGDTKNTDDQWLEHIAIKEAIGDLSEREQKIVRMRFFEGRTQMEVAKEIHVSANEMTQRARELEVRFCRNRSGHRGEYAVTYYIRWQLC